MRFFYYLLLGLIPVILFQSCSKDKENKQAFVNNYLNVIKEIKNRSDVIKRGSGAIIAYRKSGFMDIDNAEVAKNSFIEGIKLDSISLLHLKLIKTPDSRCEEIINNISEGINSVIKGNILFAANYSKAKNQNIEERKETILNVKPGMRFLAEGMNSLVKSIVKMQDYVKENNLNGEEELSTWYKQFKLESDNISGFLTPENN
jgi:hypothetical protein